MKWYFVRDVTFCFMMDIENCNFMGTGIYELNFPRGPRKLVPHKYQAIHSMQPQHLKIYPAHRVMKAPTSSSVLHHPLMVTLSTETKIRRIYQTVNNNRAKTKSNMILQKRHLIQALKICNSYCALRSLMIFCQYFFQLNFPHMQNR